MGPPRKSQRSWKQWGGIILNAFERHYDIYLRLMTLILIYRL